MSYDTTINNKDILNSILNIENESDNFDKIFESIDILVSNDIITEGIDFTKIKKWFGDRIRDIIELFKKLGEIIANFVRDRIYKPFISLKNKLLDKIKNIKPEDVSDKQVSDIEVYTDQLFNYCGQLSDELASTQTSIAEANSITKCTVLTMKNEGAIDRVAKYFDQLTRSYDSFDNLIKSISGDNIDSIDTTSSLDEIKSIRKNIKHDGDALIFQVEKRKASITDILSISYYNRIFSFVETNGKKLYDIKKSIKKTIDTLSKALLDADKLYQINKKNDNKVEAKLYSNIGNVLNKTFQTTTLLKRIVLMNMKYIDVARRVATKNISILSKIY